MTGPQQSLFPIDLLRIAKEAVDQIGGAKAVALLLYPDLSMESAEQRVLKDLNPNAKEVMSPERWELLKHILGAKGCHMLMHACCEQACYRAPAYITNEEAVAEAATDIRTIAEQATGAISAQLDRLERMMKITRVSR